MNEHDSASEALLIARFRTGDTAAFAPLLNPYRQRLHGYLNRMLGDAEAAKDVLQDVLVKVLQGLPKYREQQKFASWLFRIAHNLVVNELQKRKRKSAVIEVNNPAESEVELSTASADETFSPEYILHKKELKEILDAAIAKLPLEQKQVLLLREYGDMPFKDIAQILHCPLNTVLGRMRYALLNLRKLIQQEIGGGISNVL